MSQLFRGLLLAGLTLAVAAILPGGRLAAQAGKGVGVKISTVDGVELHGMFYASPKREAPTVILLHALGDSALNKKAYTSLAETLQPFYSVMVFDFRGHGKSKEITPEKFWSIPQNAKLVKGAPKKSTIEVADFDKNYFPAFCNDIAAVKAWLDRKNDGGECNTSSTILIGAESGATLGAIWLNSQWNLHRLIPNPTNPLLPGQPNVNSEGKDVIACIWLTITPQLGKGSNPVSLSKVLEVPVRTQACPTVFMYGDKDDQGKDWARSLTKNLKDEKDKKYEFIVPYPVEGNTKLRGIALIQNSLGTEKAIIEYLATVVDKKGGEWLKRDFRGSGYVWRLGGNWIPAKNPALDPNNLTFDGYDKFAPR